MKANLVLCLALAWPAAALATPLSELDTSVVAHQHAVNQTEIEMGTLATTHGGNAVKKYGATLVKDHTEADREMSLFAKTKGMPAIPPDSTSSDADKQDAADMTAKLKAEKDDDFDRDFLKLMSTAHERELVKIDADIGIVADKNLVTLLKKIKPVLQTHADTAKSLQKTVTSSLEP
jgi:predicted outer membrane protein